MNQKKTLLIMIAIASAVILVGCTASMLQSGEEWQAARDQEEQERMAGTYGTDAVVGTCSGGSCSGGSSTGGCTTSSCYAPD